MQLVYHVGTKLKKVLVINRDYRLYRVSIIFMKEELGF
jgi:hypothetical protein